MEPQFSVLLYSKFSTSCTQLISTIEHSIDFISATSLQFLCIDNDNIRKRILNNSDIEVSKVPCVLIVYSNGNVEKYDGGFAFQWVNAIIQQLTPPPQKKTITQPEPQPESEPQNEGNENGDVEEYEHKVKIPKRMRRVKQGKNRTSITDIPHESDRHISLPAPPRIRQDENSYIEDSDMFKDEPIDYRREPANAILKKSTERSQNDPHGVMARMKEIEKERQKIDANVNPPSKRPTNGRRP